MAAGYGFGWWAMSAWLSPGAAWFILFNAVVGAIAVMSSYSSRARQQHEPGTRRKPIRTASAVVLDSLRSVSMLPFHSAAGDYGSGAYSAPQLREPAATSLAQEEAVVLPRRVPVAALGTSAKASERPVDPSSIGLDEAYALACARRRSPADAAASDTVATATGEREPPAEVEVRANRCWRGTEEVEGKAEVNARAERFIRQFREELKLERINSILNHTDALRRGTGAAP